MQVCSPYSGIELGDDLHMPDLTLTTPGWIGTGDVGTVDTHGRLRLLGRTGDQLLAGLWPRDILDALGEVLGARTASIVPAADSLGIQLLSPLPEGGT